jgi:hypothetical protein
LQSTQDFACGTLGGRAHTHSTPFPIRLPHCWITIIAVRVASQSFPPTQNHRRLRRHRFRYGSVGTADGATISAVVRREQSDGAAEPPPLLPLRPHVINLPFSPTHWHNSDKRQLIPSFRNTGCSIIVSPLEDLGLHQSFGLL